MAFLWNSLIRAFDDRRDIVIPGDSQTTLNFCLEHFIAIGEKAIAEQGQFSVALSGGNTPKAIFQRLVNSPSQKRIDWSKTFLFWSDERCVDPHHEDSNYYMAMQAGFNLLPIPKSQIWRMPVENNLEENAKRYEEEIKRLIPQASFDLVMLGMGEDGHTASLFPKTHALHTQDRLVIENFIPQKNVWRMTMTYACINQAKQIAIYVLGQNKSAMVRQIFNSNYQPDEWPAQRVGTPSHKALWILDKAAASDLEQPSES